MNSHARLKMSPVVAVWRMIPKSRSLVLDRLNAENIEKVHHRHLLDFIDVHRLDCNQQLLLNVIEGID